MIGIDIVSISRVENIYNKFGDKFLNKVFKIEEIDEIKEITIHKRRIERIAGRFALKEAVIKAFKGDIFFKDIQILSSSKGAPICKVRGKIVNVSISHENQFAVAVASIK